MKKTIFILTLALTLLLVSCKVNVSDKPDSGSSSVAQSSTQVYVFTDNACSEEEVYAVEDCLVNEGYEPKMASGEENYALEIIIGKIENKDASKRAYTLLERIEKEDYFDSRYLVYSDGNGSIAIAFDRYTENYVEVSSFDEVIAIINYYINNGTLFSSEKGVLGSGKINLVEKQRKIDDAILEEQWNKVFEAAGGDANAEMIVESLKNHYSIYTDNMIAWLADLYDPIAGGFYYSNSGRNTEGYLADIETTSQVLDILKASGMISFADNDIKKALPEHLRNGIIKFIKSRQDPNGYFYHPQWTHEMVDAAPSRRARDLSKGISTLKSLGALPTYPNPLGSDYDGIDADGNVVIGVSSAITTPLRKSTVSSVSKVIPTATTIPQHMVNDVTFKEWLAKFDLNGDSYTVGNDIAAQTGQIIARDKQLIKEEKNYLLSQILIDWFNANCYESTGHWNSIADYEGTNGLLKISAAYLEIAKSGLGVEAMLPYPEQTMVSLVDALRTEEYARTDCYAYNVWYSICNLFELIKISDPVRGAEFVKSNRAMLLSYVTEKVSYEGQQLNAIEITTRKTANFKKIDGSFSQTAASSAPTAQGLPVAVPNTNEGDVNATTLSSTGITSRMFAALGLPMPDIFTHADAMVFFNRIENLGAIIKDVEHFENTGELGFDDLEIGEEPSTITNNSVADATLTIGTDPTDKTNKVLHLSKLNSSSVGVAQIDFGTTERIDNYNAFVFEADMMFDFADDENFLSNYFYLKLGTSRETFGYYLIFSPSRTGTIRYQDSSNSTNGIKSPDLVDTGIGQGEWFNLKVEYYIGDQNTTRIFIYINGGLSYVSNNFYGPKTTDPAGTEYEPLSVFTTARLHTDKSYLGDIYFDNFNLYQANKTMPKLELGKQEPMPKDVPDDVLTFEDAVLGKKPDSIVATQNNALFSTTVVSDPADATNKVLKFSKFNADKTYGANVKFVPHKTSAEYNAAVFSADMLIDYCDKPVSTLIYSMGNHKETAFMLMINRLSDGRLRFRAISNSSGGISEYYMSYVKEKEWFNFKIEYYKGDASDLRIKVYINDELFFVTDNFYGPKASDPEGTEYSFVEQFTGMTLSTYGDWQGIVYFDNVSFEQTNLTCSDDAIGAYDHRCNDADKDRICDRCKDSIPLDIIANEEFEKNGVAILPVKGGALGIVTFIHDDGDYQSAVLIDALLEKYGLRADVAMVVSNVWDTKNNMAKSTYLDWQGLFNSGRWGLINHSMTHTFWGDASAGTVDADRVTEEVITSGEILRTLFPGQRVLTYAYPGISSVTNTFGMSVYDAVKLAVKENYIAGRNYSKTSQKFYDWDWEFMPAESITDGLLDNTLNTLSVASKGNIATIFVHKVVSDEDWKNTYSKYTGNTYTSVGHIEKIIAKIAEYEKNGKIWNALFEEAALYLKEAECASVSKTERDGKIFVSVTHTLDSSVYDYPLTVKIKLDSPVGRAVKVTQGSNESYAYIVQEGEIFYTCVDVKPNAGEAEVSFVELTEIPYDKIPEYGGENVEHNCSDFDQNVDYYCDICKEMIAHEHIDSNHDDVCDKCSSELEHSCYDGTNDYVCDKCGAIFPHEHKDDDGNYMCDFCEEMITHDHIDENHDDVCDKCSSELEHSCYDGTNDYICDRCDAVLPHEHKDNDDNYICDYCKYKIPHEHINENGDTSCDRCGLNMSDEEGDNTENLEGDGWV